VRGCSPGAVSFEPGSSYCIVLYGPDAESGDLVILKKYALLTLAGVSIVCIVLLTWLTRKI
jgi:hypothetical protein